MNDQLENIVKSRKFVIGSNYSNDINLDPNHVLPDIVLWIYLSSFVTLGIIFNLIVLRALCKGKCNGTYYLIIQLVLSDITSLLVAGPELFYMNYRRWTIDSEICYIYLGFESFASTATIYFIIAIGLHAISTYNLAKRIIKREDEIQQDGTNSDNQEDDDNYEATISLQQRSLTIDYRHRKTGISVVLPVVFIWFLSISVSVPLFVFGNVLPSEQNPELCGLINFDYNNNLLMQLLLLIIRVVLPTVCLLTLMLLILWKIWFDKTEIRSCGLEENVMNTLKIFIALAITFLIFSMQRIYGSLLFEILSKPFMHYKYPNFEKTFALVFCMLYYGLPALRPLIYLKLNKHLRSDMNFLCNRKSVSGIRLP